MTTHEDWNKIYIDKLKPYEEFINYMEELYGITISEWEATMTPLHYLMAMDEHYEGKLKTVSK